jgi:hypothetical protein
MQKIILLITLITLTSCSSVIRTPQSRMISPEAQGKFLAGSIEGRIAATKGDTFEFRGNDTKEPISGTSEDYKAGFMADLGLLERLDVVYLDYLSGATVGVYGLKFQILGESRQKSKEGNFSLSLMGAYGKNSASHSHGDNDLGDWTTNVEDLDYKLEHHEFGLILGYRWATKLLHYANAYYFHDNLRGEVTTDNNTLQDAKFKGTQDGMIYSMGLSYDLGASWYVKGDLSHMDSRWNSFRGTSNNSFNGAIGVAW